MVTVAQDPQSGKYSQIVIKISLIINCLVGSKETVLSVGK